MRKIDVSEWKEFKVGDLFDIHPTKAYKMTNAQLLDDGETPVIVNSAYNNGIGGYSTQNPTESGNMITFSDTVDANTIFYQPRDFVGYPHVQGLYPIKYKSNWNKCTYLFFVGVFRKEALRKGFDYGNKFRRDIAKELTISLPATPDGAPDWQYMEEYIRQLLEESEAAIGNLRRLKEKKKVDMKGWKEFRVGDIGFEIIHGARQTKADREDGDIPLLTAGKENQGLAEHISNPFVTCTDAISIDMFGNSFFHKGKYAGDDNIYFFVNSHLSSLSKMFISFVINKYNEGKYGYNHQFRQSQADNLVIPLPATPDGKPDYDFMESYIKGMIDKTADHVKILN